MTLIKEFRVQCAASTLSTKALLASLEPKRSTYRLVPVEINRTLVLFRSKECSNV